MSFCDAAVVISLYGGCMASFQGEIRPANLNDIDHIFRVLEAIAWAIPLELEGLERREKILACIGQCCCLGCSYIAEMNGQVIGFLLVEEGASGGLVLPYGGVSKEYQRRGAFTALISEVKKRGQPIRARVRHDNKSAMVDHLKKYGFRCEDFNAVQSTFTFP
jgi:ribosomal protein S18 acetylase RimI-like enzyme